MYFTAGATALYVASSYWYNFRSIPTLARGRGEIIAALQRATNKGIPPLEIIVRFGEINARFLFEEIIEFDFSAKKFPGPIPYRYIPYHQSIKNIIVGCGITEAIVRFNQIKSWGYSAAVITEYCLGGFDITNTIKYWGKEAIPLLKQAVVDFDLESWEARDIITSLGKEAIPILKEAGVDFSRLESQDIRMIIISQGKKIIPLLKQAGVDLGRLRHEDIKYMICASKEKQIIPLLKEAGVDFGELYPMEIQDIILSQGYQVIPLLKQAGVDLGRLTHENIENIIYKFDPLLKKSGAPFESLCSLDIRDIILSQGYQVIPLLKQVGVDLGRLTHEDIKYMISFSSENEVIPPLKEAGVDVCKFDNKYCDEVELNHNSTNTLGGLLPKLTSDDN